MQNYNNPLGSDPGDVEHGQIGGSMQPGLPRRAFFGPGLSRRELLTATGKAAVPAAAAVSGVGNVLQLAHAGDQAKQIADMQGELATRNETDALTRISTAEQHFNALRAMRLGADGKEVSDSPTSDIRRANIQAIARGIAADPELSGNPLAAFRYACDNIRQWGRATYPGAYDSNSTRLFPGDFVLALGLSFREPATGKEIPSQSAQLLGYLRATNTFFADLAFEARDAATANNNTEAIRADALKLAHRTDADRTIVDDIASVSLTSTDDIDNLALYRFYDYSTDALQRVYTSLAQE